MYTVSLSHQLHVGITAETIICLAHEHKVLNKDHLHVFTVQAQSYSYNNVKKIMPYLLDVYGPAHIKNIMYQLTICFSDVSPLL